MSADLKRQMAAMQGQIDDLRRLTARLPLRIAPSGGGGASGGDGAIWGRLTEATQDGANRRWVYTFVQVQKLEPGFNSPGWSAVEDGETGECRNLMEAQNGTTGMTGIGLTIEEIEDGACPFELQPIVTGSSGPIVRLWPIVVPEGGEEGEDITEWWFSVPNSVKSAD